MSNPTSPTPPDSGTAIVTSQVPVPIEQLKAPAPEPPKKDEVAEVKDQLREMFKARLKGVRPEPKADDKIVKEGEKVPVKEEPKEEPPKEEKKPVKVTKKQRTNEEELVKAAADSAAAARAAVELVGKREAKEPPRDEKKSDLEQKLEGLPERIREDIPIFKAMESKWPDKYKGFTDKYLKSAGKTADYKKAWEKDNPGQEFDINDEQHASFLEENEVTWDSRDYSRAIAALESEEILKEERKKSDEKIRTLEAKTIAQDLEPEIRGRQAGIAKEILKAVRPELEGLVNDHARLDDKVFEKLKAEDPFTAEAVLSELAPLAVFIREAEKLFHPSGMFKFDGANPTHNELQQFWIEQEDKILDGTPSEQRDERGRMFLKFPDYVKTPDNMKGRYWTLEKDQLIALRKDFAKEQLEKRLEDLGKKLELSAKYRGFTKGDVAKSPQEELSKTAEKAATNGHKVSGPSASGDVKVDTLASGQKNTPTDFRSLLKARLRGDSLK